MSKRKLMNIVEASTVTRAKIEDSFFSKRNKIEVSRKIRMVEESIQVRGEHPGASRVDRCVVEGFDTKLIPEYMTGLGSRVQNDDSKVTVKLFNKGETIFLIRRKKCARF